MDLHDHTPPDLLASFTGQRQRAAVFAGLFGATEAPPAIGRFTLLRKLGAGGMGVVYAAHDPRLDRLVALKLLRGHAGRPADLLREARLLAQLAHPNIVAVFDVGEAEGRPYVAMEHLAGETLRDWAARAPRTWQQVVAVMLQAGQGLAAAHTAGVVHRDFKPDNVIIDAAGRVRVLDFGLAEGDARDTARASAGTRGYVAPEQLAGHGDARADQYSFCVTLHELLHDRRPDQPGPQRKIPRWLAQAVARGLHSEPHARWSALAPLLAELEQAPRRQRNTWRRLGLAGLLGLQLAATGAVQHLRAALCPAQRITAAATVRAASVDEASAPTCTRRAAHPRELLSHNWEPACITAPT